VSCCGQSAERSAAIQSSLKTLSVIEAPRPSRAIVRPERLCVVTTRYNPLGWRRPEENYQRFRAGIESAGVPLFTLHCDFDGTIQPSLYDFVRRASRYKHLLWQKEAGINEAVREIQRTRPGEFDAVAWIDADILFQNPNWVTDTLDALGRYRLVQLFETFRRLRADGSTDQHYPGAVKAREEGRDRRNPGGAWAARLDTFNSMGGLFPWNFFGGGDDTCYGVWTGSAPSRLARHCGQVELMRHWRISAHSAIRRSVGRINGEAVHLFHGSMVNRQYSARWNDPQIQEIDTTADLEIDAGGLLAWRKDTCDCKRDAVNSYFKRREEDGERDPWTIPNDTRPPHDRSALGESWASDDVLLITAADDRYLPGAYLALATAARFNRVPMRFYSLGCSPENPFLKRIAELAEVVEWPDRGTVSNWQTWIKPRFIRHALAGGQRVIWLDADTTVGGSLEEVGQPGLFVPDHGFFAPPRNANKPEFYKHFPAPLREWSSYNWPCACLIGIDPAELPLVEEWQARCDKAMSNPAIEQATAYFDQGPFQDLLPPGRPLADGRVWNNLQSRRDGTLEQILADSTRHSVIMHFGGRDKPWFRWGADWSI